MLNLRSSVNSPPPLRVAQGYSGNQHASESRPAPEDFSLLTVLARNRAACIASLSLAVAAKTLTSRAGFKSRCGVSAAKMRSSLLEGRRQGSDTLVAVRQQCVQFKTSMKSMPFEQFNDRTIEAVVLAKKEAKRLGQDRVGTEFLVLGVIAEGSALGCRVLTGLGIELEGARLELRSLLGKNSQAQLQKDIPFTTAAKQALEDTIDCARTLGCDEVDTSHLLLSILHQESANGSFLLKQLLKTPSAKVLKGELLRLLAVRQVSKQGNMRQGHLDVDTAATPPAEEVDLSATLRFGRDLTLLARSGQLDPLIGRQEQLEHVVRILGRRSKNNPVLIGQAGVGKTSIAYGLAQRIVDGDVPHMMRGRRVIQLDLALLLAGTRYRGDFEERLKEVIREVTASSRRVILVIDEVHMLVGAGGTGNSDGGVGIDAANLLKPALASGGLQCIGATTIDEYRQHIERDPALERRFQPVHVPEPSEAEAEEILKGLAAVYERHHGVRYTPEALHAAVSLSVRYVSGRQLPDKAIDVIDEAAANIRQKHRLKNAPHHTKQQERLLSEANELRRERRALLSDGRHTRAAELLRTREADLREQVWAIEVREATLQNQHAETLTVDGSDVAKIVAAWTNIPVAKVTADESERLLKLEAELERSIIGQPGAVKTVSHALRRSRTGLRDPRRPIAALMFCGPTGVGKTALCKCLASKFFGSEDAMVRLDMSEFMEKHTVSKLIGAPPGYVGYNEGGTLTQAIRQKPYSLVLFDEIEKAHPDIFNIMLQLLDDGRLTDSRGQTVSFAHSMVIMTSNIGSRQVQRGALSGGLGFETDVNQDAGYDRLHEIVLDEAKVVFRPEFLNRIDDMVVFKSLSVDDIAAIAEVEIKKVLQRLQQKGIEATLTKKFKEKIVAEGFDPAYGARPLQRAVTRLLEDTLAQHVLQWAQAEDENTSGGKIKRYVVIDIDESGAAVVGPGASSASTTF